MPTSNVRQLKIGTRVRLKVEQDRFPHFVAPAGLTGWIAETDSRGNVIVRLDHHLPGAEEWDNCVHLGNPHADLEPIPQFSRLPFEFTGGEKINYRCMT